MGRNKSYSEEVQVFILDNYAGIPVRDLVCLINQRFSTDYRYGQIKAYLSNNKLKTGTQKGISKGFSYIYPVDVQSFIEENIKGNLINNLTVMVNESFKTEYSIGQIRAYVKSHGLKSGIDAKIKSGHIPANKGKKGYYSPGCEKGWFNSGNTPHNYLPVGTEITDSMGYLKIKTADPNTWKFKHKLMYLENHGSIPNDHIIIFLDNDKLNVDITNLKAITKQEHMEMIRSGLRTYDSELTQVGINVAKLKVKTFEKIKNKNTKNH